MLSMWRSTSYCNSIFFFHVRSLPKISKFTFDYEVASSPYLVHQCCISGNLRGRTTEASRCFARITDLTSSATKSAQILLVTHSRHARCRFRNNFSAKRLLSFHLHNENPQKNSETCVFPDIFYWINQVAMYLIWTFLFMPNFMS